MNVNVFYNYKMIYVRSGNVAQFHSRVYAYKYDQNTSMCNSDSAVPNYLCDFWAVEVISRHSTELFYPFRQDNKIDMLTDGYLSVKR